MFRRNPIKGAPLEKCPGGTKLFYVSSDGKIGPCPWICKIDPNLSAQVLQPNEIHRIEKLDCIQQFRMVLNQRELYLTECKMCSVSNCGLGCPLFSKLKQDSYFTVDPICTGGVWW